MTRLVLIALIIFTISQSTTPCNGGLVTWLFPKHEFRIENELSENQVLGVHCQSISGVDLKLHRLPPQGVFNFSFERHPFGPSRVLCLLWKPQAYFEFEITDNNLQFRGFCGSDTCTWKARDDAIYRYKGGKVLKYYADWTGTTTDQQETLTRSSCSA